MPTVLSKLLNYVLTFGIIMVFLGFEWQLSGSYTVDVKLLIHWTLKSVFFVAYGIKRLNGEFFYIGLFLVLNYNLVVQAPKWNCFLYWTPGWGQRELAWGKVLCGVRVWMQQRLVNFAVLPDLSHKKPFLFPQKKSICDWLEGSNG